MPHRPWLRWLAGISPAYFVAVLLLTLVAIFLRQQFLDGPMRYDEAFTVWRYATEGSLRIIADYSLPNNHILHTVLVHGAWRLLGMEPWAVRMPAFIAGVALVPLGFLVFARIAGQVAGVTTAGLICGWSVLVDFSVNARGYTLAAAFSLIAVALAAEIRSGERHPWQLWTLGVTGALGLWTIPVFLYPLTAVVLWLAAPDGRRSWRDRIFVGVGVGTLSILLAAVLYAPVMLVGGLKSILGNKFVTPDPFDTFSRNLPHFLDGVAGMWTHNVPMLLVGLLAIGVVAALADSHGRGVMTLAWSFLLGTGAVLLVHHVSPPPRVMLVILPICIGIAAAGLVGITSLWKPADSWPPWIAIGAVAAMTTWLFVSVVTATTTLSGQNEGLVDAEAITLDLEPLLTPNTYLAAAIPSTAPIRYYFELYGLPVNVLREPDTPDQVFVVTFSGQTVEDVLASTALEGRRDAVLVSRYPSGSLWRLSEP
ncbi:MAG: hypothetical protein WB239_07255 [Acidimicrobiia bacterium]